MKKVFSLFIVLAMILSFGITAAAADVTVNINGGIIEDHTFSAYMILSGNYDSENNNLSNVEWGTGIVASSFLGALKADTEIGNYFIDCADAASVANAISAFADDSPEIRAFAKIALKNINAENAIAISTSTTSLDYGYYLIVDTTDVQGEDKAANASILAVVGEDIVINLKTDKPFVEKKVMENAKWTDNNGYNDVADWNIGDNVPFKVYSKVPDLTYYDKYVMIFHDTMDAGFTLNADTITVKIGNVTLVKDTDYTVTQEGQTFDVKILDLKNIANISKNDDIVIDYTALLNSNAVIGLEGNENIVYLEYSNVPDSMEVGGTTEETGRTLEDKVIVFTYGAEITKVDGADTSITLKGAEFILKNFDGTKYAKVQNNLFTGWTTSKDEATKLVTGEDGLIIVKGLDDGEYLLEEITAPAGYNILAGNKTIKIEATTANGNSWDGIAANALTKVSSDTDNDSLVEIQVINNKGAILPETGGMGEVIFVTVGLIMVVFAIVFLVTRKKMSIYEN